MTHREPSFRPWRRLGFPRPLPWGWWRYAEAATKRSLWQLFLRIFIPFGLMFIVISLLPLFPKTSTANFVVAAVAFGFLILTLVVNLRSLKEAARLTDQIHAEVAAKKDQSSRGQ